MAMKTALDGADAQTIQLHVAIRGCNKSRVANNSKEHSMANFEKDLFISYAHIDNQPLTCEQKGWISRFHATLEALLSMRLGQTAKIWRDDKLQGNDVFAEEIVDQFTQTAVLVSVLTPRYLYSEWCTRDVRELCKRAERSGGVVVDN